MKTVDYWLEYLDRKGCIVIEIGIDCVWYFDRNMNKCCVPVKHHIDCGKCKIIQDYQLFD